jgi:putative DNA primase/helicase
MSGPPIAPALDRIPAYLIEQPRWLLWREVVRKGKPTKVPLTSAGRAASSTDPRTWAPFETIAGVLRLPRMAATFHGIGIALGDLGQGEHVCGIDVDACLDAQGNLAAWAQPIVAALAALAAYLEISPSGSGLKAFFLASAADASAVREAFGIEANKWGSKRSVPAAANGQEHGPAIEAYLGPGRYFAVTGRPWTAATGNVALLDRAALLAVAALIAEATAAPDAEAPQKPKVARGKRGAGRDTSRSAAAFRLGARLRREGASFEQMCEAIRTHPDTADWCHDKGDADSGRELRNVWQHAAPGTGPIIRVLGGRRHDAANAGLVALAAAGIPFYQRDRHLVRVARIKAKASDGATALVPSVMPVNTAMLGRVLGQSARWERIKADGEIIAIDPPDEVVEQIAAMTDEWPFPPLRGLIDTPTLRPDGSLLASPGYDAATGFVLFNPPAMPAIPERPDKADALDALALLNNDLLDEFPFTSNASLSVAMSMLLTPVLRAAMAVVPAHVVTAPEAGTGKSYLADIASAIAVGERCPVLAMAKKEEETEKRLIGAALTQRQIIAVDNVSGLVMGDFLCQVTERPVMEIRPLGTSDMLRVPNAFTTFINGNNLVIGADNVRRCVQCALDADMETPEERQFRNDPVALVLAERGKYIAACLTIARAYIVAGRPGKLPPRASYEGWSDLVRSALVWLGWSDPVETVAAIRSDDPIRQQRAAVFTTWAAELIPTIGYQTSELIEQAEAWAQGNRIHPELFAALFAVAAPRGGGQQIDPVRLGLWLRANLDTVARGWKLTVDRTDKARPRWALRTT